jgi:hypothetical protein
MRKVEMRIQPGFHALLAFGRRVTATDAFDDLLSTGGWQLENWSPTFGDPLDQKQLAATEQPTTPSPDNRVDNHKHILRRPIAPVDPPIGGGEDAEPRIMVASVSEFPSLYFVEWHYIDFVLSCVGSVSKAARVLGIRRSTLQRKRKKNPPSK